MDIRAKQSPVLTYVGAGFSCMGRNFMAKQSSIQLMTKGSIAKQIIGYAIPIFIGYLFQQLYNTVDALIVGNFLGQNALAAVTSVGSLIFLGLTDTLVTCLYN